MKGLVPLLMLAASMATAVSAATAQTPYAAADPRAGRAFALEVCTPCHVVAADQRSPHRFADAPDFRAIANTRGVTATSLSAVLRSQHPTMPNLILSPEESRDVISYILSLKQGP